MEQWLKDFKDERQNYGITQEQLAIYMDVSKMTVNRIETGKYNVSKKLREKLQDALVSLKKKPQLSFLFDYVRIRIPTNDFAKVVEDILCISLRHFRHEEYGFYTYSEHYALGNIFILISEKVELGTLIELKGQGCREFEQYLELQGRTWYDFFHACWGMDAVFKRIDLAINDHVGILKIGSLIDRCRENLYWSKFKSFEDYSSGRKSSVGREAEKATMGRTLYIGSKTSEIYFCLYEKDYEQFVKKGIAMEEADIKNRFEIRLKDERAFHAIYDFLEKADEESTIFSIINNYVRFFDAPATRHTPEKPCPMWEWFLGKNRDKLKLTTKPEPYRLEKTIGWLEHQVMPSQKMLERIDALNGTSYMKEIASNVRLSERHLKIIKQQTTPIEDMVNVNR